MMKNKKLGFIVLNYNNWEDTYITINSILNLEYDNMQIYLIDNNSSNKISNNHLKFYKNNNIVIFYNEFNNGYSSGNNIGLRLAKKDSCYYYIIVNNDVIFHDNEIVKLLNFYDNSSSAIVGPKVVLPNNKVQDIGMHFYGSLNNKYKSLLNKITFNIAFKNFNIKFYTKLKTDNDYIDVFYVSGCCFLFSKKYFDCIYPLNENYFLYYEESSLGLKLKKMNLTTSYYTRYSVLHNHAQSTKDIGAKSYAYFIQSEYYYYLKEQNSIWFLFLPLLIYRRLIYFTKIVFKKNFFSNYLFLKKLMRDIRRR